MTPDWSMRFKNADVLERDVEGIKYTGPGFYLTETDTTLIYPLNPPTWGEKWDSKDRNQPLMVYVWNCVVGETIFAITIPTQRDDRG